MERQVQGYRQKIWQRGWRTGEGSRLEIDGSFDLYGDDGRSAYNSINFVTCHDGFTLDDLVSYNSKHNGPILKIISMGRTTMTHGIAASKEKQMIPVSFNSGSS